MRRVLIIPAAGLGSRLKSDQPKPLTLVNGRPMIDHVIERFRSVATLIVVVAHPSFAGRLRAHLTTTIGDTVPWHVLEQLSPTGMLDAILIAAPAVENAKPDRVWIVWCDQAALLPQTIDRIARLEEQRPAPDLVLPTVKVSRPYTHLQRDASGRIVSVLQRREGDEMPAEGESDSGLFALSFAAYRRLQEFSNAARHGDGTGERNFLPFVAWLAARGSVSTVESADPREAVGINTPEELQFVERWLRERSPQS